MKPDYLLCDVCGSKVPNGMTVFFPEGTEMDASGNGHVDTGINADLCLSCLRDLVQRSIRVSKQVGSDYELGSRFAELFRAMRMKTVKSCGA